MSFYLIKAFLISTQNLTTCTLQKIMSGPPILSKFYPLCLRFNFILKYEFRQTLVSAMKILFESIDLKDNRIDISRGKNWFFNLGPCNITWKYYCVRKKFSYCNKKVLVFLMFFEIGLMPKNSYHRDWRLPRRCSTFLYLKGLQNWGHIVKVW